jgi:biopolymer transport protein ExbD
MKASYRGKPLVEAQFISLADMAFLIIFFFMMTASFMKDKVGVNLPDLPKTSKTDSGVMVAVDAKGSIYLDGQPVDGPETLEGLLRVALEDHKGPKAMEVRLRCEKALKYKQYAPVYGAISNAGGVIAIVHDPRK